MIKYTYTNISNVGFPALSFELMDIISNYNLVVDTLDYNATTKTMVLIFTNNTDAKDEVELIMLSKTGETYEQREVLNV